MLSIYMYIYTLSTVRKSAQYYCREFTSINVRLMNYKCIIATIVSCVLSQSSGYTVWKKNSCVTLIWSLI